MEQRGLSRRRFLSGLAVSAGGATAGCLGAPTAGEPSTSSGEIPTPRPIDTPPADDEARYAEVIEATIDSVAMVQAIGPAGIIGQGSGFMHSPGLLLTNEHVIRGATELDIQLADKVWTTGEPIGEDAHSDLAVVEIDDPPQSAIPIEQSEYRATVGQEVVAIGNPFGLEESVSQGIVSGVGRNLPTGEGFSIPDTIQTDASVNPGNSGGPLVTMRGTYLGVITARQGQDIGFAISWRMVDRVVPSLIEEGTYDHPFIGIYTLPVTPTVAEANDLEEIEGVLVVDLIDGGPADNHLQGSTGERVVRGETIPTGGDVIIALDGHRIKTDEELSTFLALHTSPGDELAVTVIRDDQRVTEHIELGTRPSL